VLLNNARVTYCLRSTVSSSFFNFFFLSSADISRESANKIFTVAFFRGEKKGEKTSKIDERNERIDIFHSRWQA
jgi:hypothetical protein